MTGEWIAIWRLSVCEVTARECHKVLTKSSRRPLDLDKAEAWSTLRVNTTFSFGGTHHTLDRFTMPRYD